MSADGMGWIASICEGCGRTTGVNYHYVGAPNPGRRHDEWATADECGQCTGDSMAYRLAREAEVAAARIENPRGLAYTRAEWDAARAPGGAA